VSNVHLSLAPGNSLGPYTIMGALGAGGMGEVYRAHDPRLSRDVALKVLRQSSFDPDHLARFSREARAAGSLNHPNIVAVFDVGTEQGVPYVVTELLEGETLGDRIQGSPLPYRKAIEYGIQIAQALDAAHAKGIWHRDVKPANVFVTNEGRVKLLDFGIAKLSERAAASAPQDPTAETQAGEVRGTAGYMAPEQVLGAHVDHRADIFALGAVLYEMFTGARAFHRPSTVQTMSAVLQEDPPDPVTLNAKLPPAAAAVVRRCLEKNREERFQSARDLAFDLQQLREQTEATKPVPAAGAALRRRGLTALVVAALLVGGIGLGLLLPRDAAPTFEQLTFRRGRISGARFTPGAQAVVYSDGERVWRVDVLDSGPTSPLPLGHSGSDVLAARAGELALSIGRRFVLGERFAGTLALAPVDGGAPHPRRENVEDADWDPSGTRLATAVSSGGQSWIEYDGRRLYGTEAGGSIRFPRVSRDGERIAFLEDPTARGVGGYVKVVDLNGVAATLSGEWDSVRGLAWSPSGDEVWFTAGAERTSRALRAASLRGKQRTILEAPGSLTLWEVAPDGRALISRDDERRAVIGVPPGQTAERDLSWFDEAGLAHLSADGSVLLFGDRLGIYLRKTDRSPPTRLGLKDGFADDLSPDKRKVLATVDSSRRLVIVPTGPGENETLNPYGIARYRGARWFPDGRRILVNGIPAAGQGGSGSASGREDESEVRAYIQHVQGGAPRQLTETGTLGLLVSPDSQHVAGIGRDQEIEIWPVAGGPPRRVPGSLPGERPVAWTDDGRSLWLFRRGEVPAPVYQVEIATGRRRLWKTLVPPDTDGVISVIDLEITPTGHAYFYSYAQMLSHLYLVGGLK
jgi:hypothetical protein